MYHSEWENLPLAKTPFQFEGESEKIKVSDQLTVTPTTPSDRPQLPHEK
jgi:hypothetical protein